VIDYKTRLDKTYDLISLMDSEESPENILPIRVQAYIYAKAVQDLLGLKIAAVLYINPLNHQIRGAFDVAEISAGEIPGLASAQNSLIAFPGLNDFRSLLQRIEQEITPCLVSYRQKVITPGPRFPDVCIYCPVARCPVRVGRVAQWS
jgi:hypothetical protein